MRLAESTARAPTAVILIRLTVGAVFFSEGIQKFLFPAALGVGRFATIGIPAPEIMAPFVGLVEIVCGFLVMIGFLTRLAAGPLLIDILVAVATTKIPLFMKSGFWAAAHEARTDYCMLLGLIFLLLVGPGSWALDFRWVVRRHKRSAMHLSGVALAAVTVTPGITPTSMMHQRAHYYLPDALASKVVSVSSEGAPETGVTVLTQAVAIKETGPKETVARFGEVYAFSPSFIAVHRDEPTAISFWNLQPDDDHDFMLADPHLNALMMVKLPALQETTYVFTFHQEGLFSFYCTMHQPEMSGQILVLPPVH